MTSTDILFPRIQLLVIDYFRNSVWMKLTSPGRYSFSMLIASEVTAAGLVIEYWQIDVSVGVWIAIILLGESTVHSGITVSHAKGIS